MRLRRLRVLTCYEWFQGFGYEGPGYLQIFRRAIACLEPQRHAHALQHLDVVMDLKHVVEVKQVLEPVEENRVVLSMPKEGRDSRGTTRHGSYLSFEMLQSMTVFLLVFTIIKGRWMTVFGGGLWLFCSASRFLCTRRLKAIC